MESTYLTTGKGLTSTSAQHLCNVAKESIRQQESKLNNLSFLDCSVELISSSDKKQTQFGTTDLLFIPVYLNEIAGMYAFCAWMREAIKFKEDLLSKARNINYSEYAEKFNITIPEHPGAEKSVTEQDIINEMNVKERNTYLELEAKASTLGKYIHPDGEVSHARQMLLKRISEPCVVKGDGRDTVVYTYTPSVESEDVETLYLELQNKHREVNKQLNAMKYKIKEEVNNRNAKLSREYLKKLDEYSAAISKLRTEATQYSLKEIERISALKIIVPEKLQHTFEYLENLGKGE